MTIYFVINFISTIFERLLLSVVNLITDYVPRTTRRIYFIYKADDI